MTQPLMDADEVFGEEGQEFAALVTDGTEAGGQGVSTSPGVGRGRPQG